MMQEKINTFSKLHLWKPDYWECVLWTSEKNAVTFRDVVKVAVLFVRTRRITILKSFS